MPQKKENPAATYKLQNFEDMPPLVPGHIKRAIISEIGQELKKCEYSLALTGLGGTGKSQLARHYVEISADEKKYEIIWWFQVERADDLKNSLFKLATCLKVALPAASCTPKEFKDFLTSIKEEIERKSFLLIFDNVMSVRAMKEYLGVLYFSSNKTQLLHHKLITSRSQEWNDFLNVGTFSLPESLDFLGVLKKENSDDKKRLIIRLGYFPLALSQASGYLTTRKYSISEYLAALDNISESIEIYASEWKGESVMFETHTMLSVWELNYRQVQEHSLARDIWHIISHMHPEHITYETLKLLISSNSKYIQVTDTQMQEAIALLSQYSFITNSSASAETKKTFFVHRLLQEITRIKLFESEGPCSKIFIETLNIFKEKLIYYQNDTSSIEICKKLRFHADLFLDWIEKMKIDAPDQYVLRINLANYAYNEMWDTDSTHAYLKPWMGVIGPEVSIGNRIRIHTLLASGYIFLDLEKAAKEIEKCFKYFNVLDVEVKKENHILVCAKLTAGTIYVEQYKWNKAEKFLKNVINSDFKVEHVEAHRMLGRSYYHLNDFEKSKKHLFEAFKLRENFNSNNNENALELAAAWFDLGVFDKLQAKYSEAKYKINFSLDMQKKFYEKRLNLGLGHTLHELGKVEVLQGHYIAAEKNYNDSLGIKYEIYGKTQEHPHIGTTLHALGELYMLQNKLKEATKYYNEAMKMQLSLYSNVPNPEIAWTKNSMGELALLQRDFVLSDTYLQQAYYMQLELYGKERSHLDLAHTISLRGRLELARKNYDDATTMFFDSQKHMEKLHLENLHPLYAINLYSLGQIELLKNNMFEAETYFGNAKKIQEKVYHMNDSHPDLVATKNALENINKSKLEKINKEKCKK